MTRVLSCALVLAASVALADLVDVSLINTRVEKGRGSPRVKVAILEPIAGFKLNLARSDGKTFEWKGGGRPGVSRLIDLDQPAGKFTWKGTLTVNLPNASTAEMPLEFETLVATPLKLTLDKDKDVDLTGRTIAFSLSNVAAKAEVHLQLENGDVVDAETAFAGEAPGTRLSIAWPETKAKPLKISLKAYDELGTFIGVDFFPWSFEIPHEDVVFDSGKSDIRGDQLQKVADAAVQAIDAIRKFGRFADVTLYVAGHTDTVGATATNRALSLSRARSIAVAFRKRGVSIPIRYEGFGEEALAVDTADEVAEEKNRRAQYIISIDAPRLSGGVAPKWQRL